MWRYFAVVNEVQAFFSKHSNQKKCAIAFYDSQSPARHIRTQAHSRKAQDEVRPDEQILLR